MVAYYAIKDLVERGGCQSFINDWESEQDYFLPAGYSFSKPAMRFESTQMIFDCVMNICKRFEAFIHFDEEGSCVVTALPGGLFSSDPDVVAEFVSDPTEPVESVILGDRQVDLSYESTVNVISAFSLERDTRNIIVYVKTANAKENVLLFKKIYLYNEPALGELEVCRNYVESLSQRMFSPILKTRWSTAGINVALQPLQFVTVDTQIFRITSIKRSFKAETNELTTSYEGEWLGGKGA
jgi:hypothetical protein